MHQVKLLTERLDMANANNVSKHYMQKMALESI